MLITALRVCSYLWMKALNIERISKVSKVTLLLNRVQNTDSLGLASRVLATTWYCLSFNNHLRPLSSPLLPWEGKYLYYIQVVGMCVLNIILLKWLNISKEIAKKKTKHCWCCCPLNLNLLYPLFWYLSQKYVWNFFIYQLQ